MLVHIDSNYFCCGIILKNNVVVKTAPIVEYMRGWSLREVVAYCNYRKWRILKTDAI